jgi:hypothetical protein
MFYSRRTSIQLGATNGNNDAAGATASIGKSSRKRSSIGEIAKSVKSNGEKLHRKRVIDRIDDIELKQLIFLVNC